MCPPIAPSPTGPQAQAVAVDWTSGTLQDCRALLPLPQEPWHTSWVLSQLAAPGAW